MDKNGLKDSPQKERFWRRQSNKEITSYQIAFDVIAGILLPVLCLIFDPVVFRNVVGSAGEGYLTRFQIFAYLGITLALLALALWLILGKYTKLWSGFITGIFYTSALFSVGVGMALGPISLIGLIFFGIGILGFIPFLTAFVFFRNGRRALLLAKDHLTPRAASGSIVLGILFIIAVPFFVQWQTSQVISQSIEQAIWGDAEASKKAGENLNYLHTIIPAYTEWQTSEIVAKPIKGFLDGSLPVTEQEIERLKYIGWCLTCFDDVVLSYGRETDVGRRHVLSTIYKGITGKDIEYRWRGRFDGT